MKVAWNCIYHNYEIGCNESSDEKKRCQGQAHLCEFEENLGGNPQWRGEKLACTWAIDFSISSLLRCQDTIQQEQSIINVSKKKGQEVSGGVLF